MRRVAQAQRRDLVERQVHQADAERAQREGDLLAGRERLALQHQRQLGRVRRGDDAEVVAGRALGEHGLVARHRGRESLLGDHEVIPAGRQIRDRVETVRVAGGDPFRRAARDHAHVADAGAVGEADRARDPRRLDEPHLHRCGLAAAHAQVLSRPGQQPLGLRIRRPRARRQVLEARGPVGVGEDRRGRRPVALPPLRGAFAAGRDLGAGDRLAVPRADAELDRPGPVERHRHLHRPLGRGELPGAEHEVGVAGRTHRERVVAVGRHALEVELALGVGLVSEIALAAARVHQLHAGAGDGLLRVGIHDVPTHARLRRVSPWGEGERQGRGHDGGQRAKRASGSHRVSPSGRLGTSGSDRTTTGNLR